jgi:RNA recognition motif-containing protein
VRECREGPEKPWRKDRADSREREGKGYRREDVKDRQLYIGNLPFSLTWQQLKDIFNKYAHVEKATIVTNKAVPKLQTRRDSARASASSSSNPTRTPKSPTVLFVTHALVDQMREAIIEKREIKLEWDTGGHSES